VPAPTVVGGFRIGAPAAKTPAGTANVTAIVAMATKSRRHIEASHRRQLDTIRVVVAAFNGGDQQQSLRCLTDLLLSHAIVIASCPGALTAPGSSWNASIVAEVASWGDTKLEASGLGAFIAKATDAGDILALCSAVLSIFVVLINRLLWRPLYQLAERRFRLD
jgi:hypothetical protein